MPSLCIGGMIDLAIRNLDKGNGEVRQLILIDTFTPPVLLNVILEADLMHSLLIKPIFRALSRSHLHEVTIQ